MKMLCSRVEPRCSSHWGLNFDQMKALRLETSVRHVGWPQTNRNWSCKPQNGKELWAAVSSRNVRLTWRQCLTWKRISAGAHTSQRFYLKYNEAVHRKKFWSDISNLPKTNFKTPKSQIIMAQTCAVSNASLFAGIPVKHSCSTSYCSNNNSKQQTTNNKQQPTNDKHQQQQEQQQQQQ